MCIIGIKPHGVEDFSEKILKHCWDKNDDGAGYAWYDGERDLWVVRKGFMKYDDFLTSYKAMKFGKKTTSIVHFRIGTSGLKDEGNTHPFPICDDLDKMRVTSFENEAIAFHNGTVGKGDAKYSDTEHHVADILFPIFPLWGDKRVQGDIADTLLTKNSSRWVVCVKDAYWRFGTWHKHNGLEFSNLNYEPTTYVHYNYGGNNYWNNDKDDSKSSADYLEAQKYGLPKGTVWAHGKLNGKVGFWSGGSFTTWQDYIEKKKKENNVIELPMTKNYTYKIDNQEEFNSMFVEMATNREGKSALCANWKRFAIHIFCIKRSKPTNKEDKTEKEGHTHNSAQDFVSVIISDEGDFVFEDKKVESEMSQNLDDYRMCPSCFEAAFLVPTPFVDTGTHLCNNCGCLFTLETGEVYMYDPEIQQKYIRRMG